MGKQKALSKIWPNYSEIVTTLNMTMTLLVASTTFWVKRQHWVDVYF